ncbi:reverse transcriptase domain-containing protein [Tanacetum coccineum]
MPISVPTSSPPLLLPSASCREDRPEVTLPSQKRLGIALGPRYEVGESSSAVDRPAGGLRADYGFVATMVREIRPFETRVRQDTDEIYMRLDDEQSQRQLLAGHMSEIRELHAADRRRQAVTSKMLKVDHRISAKMRELRITDCDHTTGIGDNTTGTSYRTVGTAGTRWRSCTAKATRGGWSTPVTTTSAPTATTTTSVTNAQLQAMIDQGVTAALAARDANRNGDDNHTLGTGGRRTERVTRECTYQDFMKCKPLYFKGTEGVVELTQWFERMETVFCISNCSVENQIKFSTCTLLAGSLTWWNSHVMTVNHDVAYAMTWADLRKKMTDKYCLRNEMKKLKAELWNLKVKGTDVIGYNQRFQELAMFVWLGMFPEESDKIERSCLGLDRIIIKGNFKITKPMTKLTQKKVKFEWGDKQETTFQLLKQKLYSVPILALPEGSEDFIVYYDASKKGLGAVLMQREKVIAIMHHAN